MARPLFSIIITCFNQRAFIADAVQSGISQHCHDREIIVVDDGSSDGSSEILQQFSHSIRLIQLDRNIGAVESRNCGAAAALGDYLVFLDGDDALMPWALDMYRHLVDAHAPKIILSRLRWVANSIPNLHQEPRPVEVCFIQHKNFISKDRTCELSASGLVVNRKTFCECGAWTPGIFYLDLIDFVAKLGIAGPAVQIISPETVAYRAHSGNSIWGVAPFIDMAHHLLERERRGEYPGGRTYRMRRRAWLGGQVWFWSKRGMQRGLYFEGLKLLADGSAMVLAAVLRRAILCLTGRERPHTEPLLMPESGQPADAASDPIVSQSQHTEGGCLSIESIR